MDTGISQMKYNDKDFIKIRRKKIEFKLIHKKFKNLFKVKNNLDLVNYLRSINSNNKTACTMQISNGAAWVCETCSYDEKVIICMECFENGNHKDHIISLKLSITGSCDCGDPEALKDTSFCSEHKGIMCSTEEIIGFINKTFNNDDKIIREISSIFNEFFSTMANIIEELEKIKEKENCFSSDYSCELINLLTDGLENLDLICEANHALRLIAVNFFDKNYSLKTKHICLQFLEKDNQFSIRKINLIEDIHSCKCSFLQNLLRIWDKSYEIKYDIQSFFFNFLKSYKFKIHYGYCYISLYDILIINDSCQIRNFSLQIIMNEDISLKLISSCEFINHLFNKLSYLLKEYILENKKDFKIINDIITIFYLDMCFLLKKGPSEIFASNINYYFWFIKILTLIQYTNKVTFSKTFQYEAFNENLILIEFYLLSIFSLIINLYDCEQIDKVEEIIVFILEMIFNNFNKRKENEFSIHLPLNRALSIVITRYCFSMSKFKKIEFLQAARIIFKNCFLKLKHKLILSQIVFEMSYNDFYTKICMEGLKLIGFMNSIYCKYWGCHGDNMLNYPNMYYRIGFYDILYNSDYSLIKILITIIDEDENNKDLFSFQNIFKVINILDIEYDICDPNCLSIKNNEILLERNYETIIQLIINDSLIFDTIFNSYEKLYNNGIDDRLYNIFLEKDFNYINELIKRKLVPQILYKDNSVSHSEILNILPVWLRENKKKSIDIILDEICDKIIEANKPIYYKIKEKYYNLSDFFTFKDPLKKKELIRHFHTSCLGSINLIYSREFNCLESQKSMDFLFCSRLFSINYLKDILTPIILKLLPMENEFSMINLLLKLYDLFINSLKIFSVNLDLKNDETYSLLNSFYLDNKSNILKCGEYVDKLKNENIREGVNYIVLKGINKDYKYLFRIKNTNISTNIIIEESSDLEKSFEDKCINYCCKCKNKIDPNEYKILPFLKIGFVSNTNFLYHSNKKILRTFYERNNILKLNGYIDFKSLKKEIFKESNSSSSLRIISCDHLIHYACFEETVNIAEVDDLDDIYFQCPECKKISNFIIPFINYDDFGDPSLKAYTFSDYLKNNMNFSNLEKINENMIIEPFFNTSMLFLSKIYKTSFSTCYDHFHFIDELNLPLTNNDIEMSKNTKIYDDFIIIFFNLLKTIQFLSISEFLDFANIFKTFSNIIRIYINNKLIKPDFFLNRINYLLKYNNIEKNYIKNEINAYYQISNLDSHLIEILILFGILFNYKDLDDFINHTLKNYLPLLVLNYYIHKIISQSNYMIDKKQMILLLFDLEDLKIILQKEEKPFLIFFKPLLVKMILLIFTYRETEGQSNLFLKLNFSNSRDEEQILFLLKELNLSSTTELVEEFKGGNNDIFLELRNKYIEELSYIEEININFKVDYMFYRQNDNHLSFIVLPKTILDMCLKYFKIKCKLCNNNPIYSLICLFCGKKLCYLKDCCNKCGEEKNMFEFQFHTLKCGKGLGCYMTMYSGRILFCLKEKFQLTNLSPYQNKFGEIIKNKKLTYDYILNEKMYYDLYLKIKNLEFLDYFVTE